MNRVAVVIAAAVLAVSGCGGTSRRPPAHPGPVAKTEQTHEYPASAPPPPEHPDAATGPNPAAAVRAFATAYINWSYATVAADLRRLARTSVGEARSAMTLASAQTAGDYELRRGQVSNHGTVEAVAAVAGQPDEYIVVTRELTTADATAAYAGLQPAWHVALATVSRQADGTFAVSAWQPQS